MNKNIIKKFTLIIITALAIFCGPVANDYSLRYFDSAESETDELRLAIFYPSPGSLNALLKLKEQGLLTPNNLVVIGIFHEKERLDYRESVDFVKDHNLDWIKFHKLKGEINKDSLFQKNSLSAEFKTIFEKSDGIIFFGGADIPPYIYNEKTSLRTAIRTPYRHFLELSFVFHLLGGLQDQEFKPLMESFPDLPVLGLCLGHQTLNVGTGGSMIQDIWSQVYEKIFVEEVIAMPRENWHQNPYARIYPEKNLFSIHLHPIKLKKDEKFVKEFGFEPESTPYILSAHHQAADILGKGMRVIATSMDGKIVEAMDHEKFPNVLGVQFHPESPSLWELEAKSKITPEEEKISSNSILKNNPPSIEFHKKIWSWFSEKLETYHRKTSDVRRKTNN